MSFQRTTWRLILHPAAAGPWNMAVDEAILDGMEKGDALPTLRLYAWEPACLSLGYAQPIEDVDLEGLKTRGWDLARRPTGGRAILHTDELTYSVIGPETEARLSGGVLESYQALSQALLKALHLLGLPAQVNEPLERTPGSTAPAAEKGKYQNPVCFEAPSSYEITLGGKKLVGSAQARRKGGVLQHGSLPLYGDLRRIVSGLRFEDEAARMQAGERLLARAATVEMFSGERIGWDRAAQAFIQAFQETLNLDLAQQDLSSAERIRAVELLEQKYTHPEWTEKPRRG